MTSYHYSHQLLHRFSQLKTQQGSVAVMALLTMLVLSAIGLGLISRSITETQTSTNYSDGIAAQYLAEAGVKRAMLEIEKQNFPNKMKNLPLSGTLGNGSYTIASISDIDTSKLPIKDRTVTSIGKVNGATRKVVATLREDSVYNYAVCAGGDFVPQYSACIGDKNNNRVDSNVRANGDVYLNNMFTLPDIDILGFSLDGLDSTIINGNIITAGKVNYIDNLLGDRAKHRKLVEFANRIRIPDIIVPQVDNINVFDLSSAEMNLNDLIIDRFPIINDAIKATWLLEGEVRKLLSIFPTGCYRIQDNRVYVRNGNWVLLGMRTYPIPMLPFLHADFGQFIEGNGVIYVNGSFSNNGTINGTLALIATGDINIGCRIGIFGGDNSVWPAEFKNGILFAGGNVFLNNCGDTVPFALASFHREPMQGCIVAKGNVTMYGNSKVDYSSDTVNYFKGKGVLPKEQAVITPLSYTNN